MSKISYAASSMVSHFYTANAQPLKSITVKGAEGKSKVAVDATLQMVATPNAGAELGTVEWSVNDTDVATISAAGLLTGVSAGKVTVTATSGSISGSLEVTVEEAAGGGVETVKATIVPAHDSWTWDNTNDTGTYTSGHFTLAYDGNSGSTKQSSYTSTDQIRVYKNSIFSITADATVANIVSVKFTTTGSDKRFATTQTFTGGELSGYTTAADNATVVCGDNVTVLSFTAANQVRLTNIEIEYVAK